MDKIVIDFVSGILCEKEKDFVIVEVGGLGYKVQTHSQLFYKLPHIGEQIKLFTHFIHKEDSMELYGFINQFDREIFRHLITVSGVGAKIGMRILSDIPYQDIINAVIDKDSNILTRVSGLGKKGAEKIILELENKFKKLYQYKAVSKADDISTIDRTAIEALLSLGYKEKESIEAVANVTRNEKLSTTEDIIKSSLKILANLN